MACAFSPQDVTEGINLKVAADHDDLRAPVITRPSLKLVNRMDEMLHAVDHDRPIRIIRQSKQRLEPQKISSGRKPQSLKEHVKDERAHGFIQNDHMAKDVIPMPVGIRVAVIVMIVMGVIVIMIIEMIVAVTMAVLVMVVMSGTKLSFRQPSLRILALGA